MAQGEGPEFKPQYCQKKKEWLMIQMDKPWKHVQWKKPDTKIG
jgi:hypothetical protein